MYLSVYVFYMKFCKSYVCICLNCMQFVKFMWHSLVGKLGMLQYVPQRERKRSLVYRGLAMGGRGCYKLFFSFPFLDNKYSSIK
jgi:hypothetical protein